MIGKHALARVVTARHWTEAPFCEMDILAGLYTTYIQTQEKSGRRGREIDTIIITLRRAVRVSRLDCT